MLDELSSKNSEVAYDDSGDILEFYSQREIEVIDSFSYPVELEYIYINEAISGNKKYVVEGYRTLEIGKEYIVYLTYSQITQGYIICDYEAAIYEIGSPTSTGGDDNIILTDTLSWIRSVDNGLDFVEFVSPTIGPKRGIECYGTPYITLHFEDDSKLLDLDSIYTQENNKSMIELENGTQYTYTGKNEQK